MHPHTNITRRCEVYPSLRVVATTEQNVNDMLLHTS